MPENKPSAPAAAPSSSKSKSPAAESGDPAVHKLLADIQTARLNGDDDELKDLTKQLADLGYE